eukprot:CAMPEP_0115733250 /NCGR_PEP_ID=MMETSP0272-20121206/85558_1 /TAXON_ID=71861 /ORGANISM="Scrippsiella trochoidea, Strain CCMP3099" /LENGTH=48 /DNA_ID= /DNA_START= /DNA_END= /DNA_ORIENTATION=
MNNVDLPFTQGSGEPVGTNCAPFADSGAAAAAARVAGFLRMACLTGMA